MIKKDYENTLYKVILGIFFNIPCYNWIDFQDIWELQTSKRSHVTIDVLVNGYMLDIARYFQLYFYHSIILTFFFSTYTILL